MSDDQILEPEASNGGQEGEQSQDPTGAVPTLDSPVGEPDASSSASPVEQPSEPSLLPAPELFVDEPAPVEAVDHPRPEQLTGAMGRESGPTCPVCGHVLSDGGQVS